MAITGEDVLRRMHVALRTYEGVAESFDKVWYASPAMMLMADHTKRPKLLLDQVLNLCHYKTEAKLLIVDQVEFFGSDELVRGELERLLANLCTS